MVTNIKADAIVGAKTKETGILPFENIALKDIKSKYKIMTDTCVK